MTDAEKKIAEIREKHSAGHYNYNYEIRDAIQFLLDELDKRDEENRKLREDIERIIEILKNGQQAHWQTFKIRQLLGVTGSGCDRKTAQKHVSARRS